MYTVQLVAFSKTTKPLELSNGSNIEHAVDIFLRYSGCVCVIIVAPLLMQRTVSEISAVFKPQMITGACHVCVFVHAHLARRLLSHITRTIVVRIVFYRP